MGKAPNTYADASVWATGSRYYIDGTVKVLSKKDFEKADIEQIAKTWLNIRNYLHTIVLNCILRDLSMQIETDLITS